jgi:putative ABC transport system ATP-binding protein
MVVHSAQVYIQLKPLFSRHNGIGVQFTDEPTGALDSKSSKMLLEKISYLNIKNMATILMVTHDAFTASYASRVIFIKDGRIFNELLREGRNRKEFFDDIMDVVTMLGGELNDAF